MVLGTKEPPIEVEIERKFGHWRQVGMPLRILLTGASGFLGRNLTESLRDDGHNVIGMNSSCNLVNQSNASMLMHKIPYDVIIHAAGSVGGIGANRQNPGKFIYENLMMGANMIEAARAYQPQARFIMLGTVCAYPKYAEVPFKEENIWYGYPEETNAPYGIAKKTLMQMVQSYYEQYAFNGVNLIPVNMYGPHDHFDDQGSHVIPALIFKIKRAMDSGQRKIVLWGDGSPTREFLYVDDCCEAIKLAIDADVGPEPINIGTGKETSIEDLAEMIGEIMGFEGYFMWDNSQPNGQPRRCLDVGRAKVRLGFEAKTSLRDGLLRTINWYTRGL